jgi:hypothetical protein
MRKNTFRNCAGSETHPRPRCLHNGHFVQNS